MSWSSFDEENAQAGQKWSSEYFTLVKMKAQKFAQNYHNLIFIFIQMVILRVFFEFPKKIQTRPYEHKWPRAGIFLGSQIPGWECQLLSSMFPGMGFFREMGFPRNVPPLLIRHVTCTIFDISYMI